MDIHMKKRVAETLCIIVCAAGLSVMPQMLRADGTVAEYVLEKGNVRAVFDDHGRIDSLSNTETGHEWTGGGHLWRLYFDERRTPEGTPFAQVREEREIPVVPEEQTPNVLLKNGRLEISYSSLKCRGRILAIRLDLVVEQEENGMLRFSASIENSEPHTIVRELHYPLVGNCSLPESAELLVTEHGGMRLDDPVGRIARPGHSPLYMGPDQEFRQLEHWGYGTYKYPAYTAANCFAFLNEREGLYVASHDPSFQDTMHILRCWPDAKGVFNRLEAGLAKYPNVMCGGKWRNGTNVLLPYSGDWRVTAKTYRAWANTWWKKRKVPDWCRRMTGWHRVIFRHQYGKDFFTPADLNGRIAKAGDSAGLDTTLCFGWWRRGMDNGYPDSYFETEPDWGGDDGWRKAIASYRASGHNFLLYFNGKLIDMESDFYLKGPGRKICYHTAAGEPMVEQYRFASSGTFTKLYNARSFATADAREPEWMSFLEKAVDRAIDFGASGVFFDQLGSCEPAANFDTSGEFSIPNVRTIAAKAEALAHLRDYIEAKGLHDFAIGTEAFVDCSAQSADYIHNVVGAADTENFTEWIRYAFPECIVSDREIRDDTDIEWRVNHNLLVGLISDVEIWRCRGLINDTPNYRRKLAEVNALRKAHPILLTGTFTGPDGITVDSKNGLLAYGFSEGDRVAVVVCTPRDRAASGSVSVEGKAVVDGAADFDLPVNGIAVVEFADMK